MIVTTSDGKIARTSPVPFGDIVEDLSIPYGVANALRDTEARGLKPLTSPQLLDLRLDCPSLKDCLWSNWYTTSSGVYVVGNNVYVVYGLKHPLTSHQRVRTAVDEGLVKYAAKLTLEESELFSGRKVEGLRDYDAFLRETQDKDLTDEQFGIIAPLSLFGGLPNNYMKLRKWVKDPRAVMLAGGKRRAEAYAEVLDRNKVEKHWLSLEAELGKEDRGWLVFVYRVDHDDYGLYVRDLHGYGRFVGVAPEAQVGVRQKNEASGEPLESKIVYLQNKRFARLDGQLYIVAPEGTRVDE